MRFYADNYFELSVVSTAFKKSYMKSYMDGRPLITHIHVACSHYTILNLGIHNTINLTSSFQTDEKNSLGGDQVVALGIF